MTTRRPPGGNPPNPGYGYPADGYPGDPRTPTTRPPTGRPVRRAPPPQPAKPSTALMALVYGGIGLLGLAVAAVTFVMIAPPTEMIQREVVSQVKKATGRDLTIGGGASFTLFPRLGLRIADVTLSAPPEMGGDPFLTARSFEVGVRLLPLLLRNIVVDRVILYEPSFGLRVDADGRRSWAFKQSRRRLAQADNGSLADANDEPRKSKLSNLSLGEVRIVDGTVHYRDERSGSAATVEAINATAGLHDIAEPLDAKGSLVWSQEKVLFDATLTSPQELLDDKPAKLVASLSGERGNLSYDGAITVGRGVNAEGAIKGASPSLRGVAEWLGTRLPRTPGFGAGSISADMRAGPHTVELKDATLTLDGATATGTVAVTTGGERPHVAANLKIVGLDLANYVGHGGYGSRGARPARADATPARAAPAPAAPAPEPEAAPEPSDPTAEPSDPTSIEDLLGPDEPSGPRVKGYVQRDGWGEDPYELSLLGLADADAKLSVERLTYRQIKVDASELSLALKDRVLKTTFTDISLYQGRGRGALTIDGSGGEAALASSFALSGIAAGPLLKDSSGIDWLAGSGDLSLTLRGHGRSETALVATLDGKADIAVRDGAIIGFNLPGAMRSLSEGRIGNLATSPDQKTDFTDLTGTFVIAGGIARNEDLKLASPLVRAAGSGTVDLPQRSLDYTVRPKLVASLSGQGGEQDLSGLEIPVHITGPWDKPDIAPDLAGVINNPKAVDAVKELGKELKGKNAGEIVDELFSKGENGEPSKAQNLLKKFLGR